MINHFKQRIPNWTTGINPVEFDFQTTEELLEHETIKLYAKEYSDEQTFLRYSMSYNGLLMAEFKGELSRPVGYITHPEKIDLTPWDGHDK